MASLEGQTKIHKHIAHPSRSVALDDLEVAASRIVALESSSCVHYRLSGDSSCGTHCAWGRDCAFNEVVGHAVYIHDTLSRALEVGCLCESLRAHAVQASNVLQQLYKLEHKELSQRAELKSALERLTQADHKVSQANKEAAQLRYRLKETESRWADADFIVSEATINMQEMQQKLALVERQVRQSPHQAEIVQAQQGAIRDLERKTREAIARETQTAEKARLMEDHLAGQLMVKQHEINDLRREIETRDETILMLSSSERTDEGTMGQQLAKMRIQLRKLTSENQELRKGL